MKIDDSFKKTGNVGIPTTTARANKGAEKSAAAVNSPATSNVDSVQISAQAQALSSNSSFDLNKVNEIKAAIANGTFQVNPEKVANGLIDTVKDLLSSRKG